MVDGYRQYSPNFFGEGLAAFNAGEDRKRRNSLESLLGAAASGGQPDYQGIASNGGDPFAVRGQLDKQREQAQQVAGQAAAYLLSMPDAQSRAQAYQQMLPRFGVIEQTFGVKLPTAWDESHAGELQQIAQQFGGAGKSQEPSDIQSLRILQQNPELLDLDMKRKEAGYRAMYGVQAEFRPPPRPDYEPQRLALAEAAARRADEAAQRAAEAEKRRRWGTPPQNMRFNDEGVLEPIPGAPPPKATAEAEKTNNSRSAMAKDAIAYAASDTGVPQDVIAKMTPEQVRDLMKGTAVTVDGQPIKRQSRWLTGPIAGKLHIPFTNIGTNSLANADLEAYANSAAGKQARINNPTGPVSNADFDVGRKSVFSPDKPDEVNADLVFNALRDASPPAAAPAPNQPAAPTASRRVGERIRNPATGEVRVWNGSAWVRQ